ncbi:hypothetical protein ACFL59_05055, partial [Planctomycetota bacterium]
EIRRAALSKTAAPVEPDERDDLDAAATIGGDFDPEEIRRATLRRAAALKEPDLRENVAVGAITELDQVDPMALRLAAQQRRGAPVEPQVERGPAIDEDHVEPETAGEEDDWDDEGTVVGEDTDPGAITTVEPGVLPLELQLARQKVAQSPGTFKPAASVDEVSSQDRLREALDRIAPILGDKQPGERRRSEAEEPVAPPFKIERPRRFGRSGSAAPKPTAADSPTSEREADGARPGRPIRSPRTEPASPVMGGGTVRFDPADVRLSPPAAPREAGGAGKRKGPVGGPPRQGGPPGGVPDTGVSRKQQPYAGKGSGGASKWPRSGEKWGRRARSSSPSPSARRGAAGSTPPAPPSRAAGSPRGKRVPARGGAKGAPAGRGAEPQETVGPPGEKEGPTAKQLLLRGKRALMSQDLFVAEKAFREAVTLDPDLAEGWVGLACICSRFSMKREQAITALEQAVRLRYRDKGFLKKGVNWSALGDELRVKRLRYKLCRAE